MAAVRSAGSGQRCNQGTAAAIVPVFAQIDTLPCAQGKTSVADGQGQRTSKKRRFDVGSHVVGTLKRVLVKRGVLGDGPREVRFKIGPDCGIGILVQGQAGAGVQDMDVQQANSNVSDLIDLGDDFIGNQVKTTWFGG